MSRKEEKKVQQTLETMEERDAEENQEELLRHSKMGAMPVGKLVVSVSLPIVISMLVQALYNVVDTIFVARLGEEAIAAVGLAFPIQNLMIAVGVGTGVGISSRLGRRLGEQNVESANRTATNGIFLMVLSSVAFALFGIFGAGWYMSAFAGGHDPAADAMIAEMGTSYLSIVSICSLGCFISIAMERFLQATGRSVFSMVTQLTGAIVNIILDPIMIFGLFGFPAMGVAGAAIATVIGQFAAMFVGIWANHAKNHELNLSLRRFRPNAKTIKHIYQVGLPSIVMQAIGSVMTFGMNLILTGFSTTAVALFSIYFKLQSFIFMPVFGFGGGMSAIVAFNYGARKPKRIAQAIRYTGVICFCIMAVGTLLFWVIPDQLLMLFDATPDMLTVGRAMLRYISISFPAAAVTMTLSGSFQALGKGVYSMIMSLVRQLVFLLPAAWLLARWGGLTAIWFSFPLAEMVAIVMAVFFFIRMWRKLVKPLERDAPLPA